MEFRGQMSDVRKRERERECVYVYQPG